MRELKIEKYKGSLLLKFAVLCFAGIDRELRGILLGATIIVVLGILIFTNVSSIRRFIFKG